MNRIPPTLDMLPDGTFAAPPRRTGVPLSMKVGIVAALVAVLGLSLAVAAAAVYVLTLVLPVIIIAAGVAWLALKFRGWQLRRGGALRSVQPGGFRQ